MIAGLIPEILTVVGLLTANVTGIGAAIIAVCALIRAFHNIRRIIKKVD